MDKYMNDLDYKPATDAFVRNEFNKLRAENKWPDIIQWLMLGAIFWKIMGW